MATDDEVKQYEKANSSNPKRKGAIVSAGFLKNNQGLSCKNEDDSYRFDTMAVSDMMKLSNDLENGLSTAQKRIWRQRLY